MIPTARSVAMRPRGSMTLGANYVRFSLFANKHRQNFDWGCSTIHAIVPSIYGLDKTLPGCKDLFALALYRNGQRPFQNVSEFCNWMLVAARLPSRCYFNEECCDLRLQGWVLNVLADSRLRTLQNYSRVRAN